MLSLLSQITTTFPLQDNHQLLSLIIAILTDLRSLLDGSASSFSPTIITLLKSTRDFYITQEWTSLSPISRSLAKDTLFLLLRCNDKDTQEFIDAKFSSYSLADIKHLQGDFQEMAAYRYLQLMFSKQEVDKNIINTILTEEYDNSNTFLLSAFSAIESDAVIASLFQHLTVEENGILTQNIMYLFKYLPSNISFLLSNHTFA